MVHKEDCVGWACVVDGYQVTGASGSFKSLGPGQVHVVKRPPSRGLSYTRSTLRISNTRTQVLVAAVYQVGSWRAHGLFTPVPQHKARDAQCSNVTKSLMNASMSEPCWFGVKYSTSG